MSDFEQQAVKIRSSRGNLRLSRGFQVAGQQSGETSVAEAQNDGVIVDRADSSFPRWIQHLHLNGSHAVFLSRLDRARRHMQFPGDSEQFCQCRVLTPLPVIQFCDGEVLHERGKTAGMVLVRVRQQ